MRLIVIGASGMIGREVYRLAMRKHIPVIGTSTKGNQELVPYNLLEDDPDILTDFLTNETGKTYCVVAAGITNIKYCFEHKKLSHLTNVTAICKLLDYLYERDVVSLYLSSDAVFDGIEGGYQEDVPPNPCSEYGRQKVCVEQYISNNMPENLIYRLPKIVDDTFLNKNVFSEFYRSYLMHDDVRCIQGLKFNPTFVADVAKFILDGFTKRLHGLYHVANPEIYSRGELARKFFEHRHLDGSVKEIGIEHWDFDEPKPLDTTLLSAKFCAEVDDVKFTSMDEVIRRFWGRVDGCDYED